MSAFGMSAEVRNGELLITFYRERIDAPVALGIGTKRNGRPSTLDGHFLEIDMERYSPGRGGGSEEPRCRVNKQSGCFTVPYLVRKFTPAALGILGG
jgi:hypothetical protein